MAGTYEQAAVGEPASSGDPKILAQLKGMNELLNAENRIQWYKPLSIATEQERENVAFGTLTTPDEIKNVVLPENGLIAIGFVGIVKSSVAAAGRVAIFIGANQLKTTGTTIPVVQEESTAGTGFIQFNSNPQGLASSGGGTSFVTTGQLLSGNSTTVPGGLAYVFAAAGTYNISVQYKATSGKVVAKERKLWCGVTGT